MVDNGYGLEPEEWADLKTNYPEYYKNIVIENQQSGGSSGGEEKFIVTIEERYDEEDEYYYVVDKTNAQIYQAYTNNKVVVANNLGTMIPLVDCTEDLADFKAEKINIINHSAWADANVSVDEIVIANDEYEDKGTFYQLVLPYGIDCELSGNTLSTGSISARLVIALIVQANCNLRFRWWANNTDYYAYAIACKSSAANHVNVVVAQSTEGLLTFSASNENDPMTATIS